MMRDELDRRKYTRMPWHDVHCAFWGSPCHDVARHFVQRWNHSKIVLVIEDKDFVYSSMNGEHWMAGKFSYSLRCSLWSEHLGLQANETKKIEDPIADAAYKDTCGWQRLRQTTRFTKKCSLAFPMNIFTLELR